MIRDKTMAEALHYQSTKEIEVNEQKLNYQFIKDQTYSNIKNIQKVYYGDSITKYMEDNLNILK